MLARLAKLTALGAASPVLASALASLKLVRTGQELRASRQGFITLGGDDRYQARNIAHNLHDACMVARIQLDMSLDDFDALIERVREQYLPWYAALEAAIQHKPDAFMEPLDVAEHYAPLPLGQTRMLTKIQFFRQDRVVVLFGDHTYLGGFQLSQFVQLVFCETVTTGIFPRNRYLPGLSELMMLGLFAEALARPSRTPPALCDRPEDVQRLYWKLDRAPLQALADELEMSLLYVVIALHIDRVMRRMGRERLRVTLPVSFESHSSFNTVGAVFLEVERQPDLPSMARVVREALRRKRWQVSASNHVQRILPTRTLSQYARDTVDFTLTVVPQKTLPHNLLKEELVDYEFTMDNIEYPVYAMCLIFEGSLYSSMMVNTPDFDVAAACEEDGARISEVRL